MRSSAGLIASPLWLVLPTVAAVALAAREGGLRRGDGDVFGRCAIGFCSGGDGDRLSSWIAGGVFRGLIGRYRLGGPPTLDVGSMERVWRVSSTTIRVSSVAVGRAFGCVLSFRRDET